MAIRKHSGKKGDTWQIDYLCPDGKRIRQSFKKKRDATEELAKRIALRGEGRYMDKKREYSTTLGELVVKYTENFKDQASFAGGKSYALKNFLAYFTSQKRADSIRYVDLETYRNYLRRKLTRHGTLRAIASVNREVACIRHLFTKAVEWDMIEKNPFSSGKALVMKTNNQRFRYLTKAEIDSLLSSCVNDYVRDIIRVILNTGMRRQEVLYLTWAQIRNGFIYLSKTKTNESRQIPINDDLAALFKQIRKAQGLKYNYVFCDTKGRPYVQVRKSFMASLAKAGIEDFRFHDLRHTFASHFVMRNKSLKDLQEILGHKSLTMTMRYAHLSENHKRKAINALNGLTVLNQTCHKMVTKTKRAISHDV